MLKKAIYGPIITSNSMKVDTLIQLAVYSVLFSSLIVIIYTIFLAHSKTLKIEAYKSPCLKYAKYNSRADRYDWFIACVAKEYNLEFSKEKNYTIEMRKGGISTVKIYYWVITENEGDEINYCSSRRRSWWFEASTTLFLEERDLWTVC